MPNYALQVGPALAGQYDSPVQSGGWMRVDFLGEVGDRMTFRLPNGKTTSKPKAGRGTTWLEELGWPLVVHNEPGKRCVAVRATPTRLAYRYAEDTPFFVRGWVMTRFEGDTWRRWPIQEDTET